MKVMSVMKKVKSVVWEKMKVSLKRGQPKVRVHDICTFQMMNHIDHPTPFWEV